MAESIVRRGIYSLEHERRDLQDPRGLSCRLRSENKFPSQIILKKRENIYLTKPEYDRIALVAFILTYQRVESVAEFRI